VGLASAGFKKYPRSAIFLHLLTSLDQESLPFASDVGLLPNKVHKKHWTNSCAMAYPMSLRSTSYFELPFSSDFTPLSNAWLAHETSFC
jgi:hypothetical protein